MARYTDADLLLEKLNKKKSETAKGRYTEGFNDAIMRVRSMVSSSTTADVVPKSEVEKIIEDTFKRIEENFVNTPIYKIAPSDLKAELKKKYTAEIPIVRDLAEEAVNRDITNKQNEE